MDREFALRLVVFEYLLPMQKRLRGERIKRAFAEEGIDATWRPSHQVAGVFEELLRISDKLLCSQWFATSYIYPFTMRHENEEIHRRQTVNALIDSNGPFVWNEHCARRADPCSGIRAFRHGNFMSAGRFIVQREA